MIGRTNVAPANSVANDLRGISAVLHEMKDESKQFVQTRMSLLKGELEEKLPNLKIAASMAGVGALFLITAFLLLTLALVALAAVLFQDSDYRWVFALLSVGVLWCVVGGVSLYFAKREFALKGLMPRRTFEVLKGDKIWLSTEAKSQV